MFRSEDYSAAEEADNCIWMDPVSSKKRRFSEEQVMCLESMFESQTKLEPRKKLQLAKELGLHPRQVAIWFQNKRARRKSKQLEREYSALIADYDALLSSFESLKSEKQVLTKQSQKLAQLLDKPVVEERGKDSDYNEIDERPSLPLAEKSDVRLKVCSDDEGNRYNKFTEKEADLCTEPAMTSSLVSAEQQFCFRPSWSSHQSCTTSQWWDFGL